MNGMYDQVNGDWINDLWCTNNLFGIMTNLIAKIRGFLTVQKPLSCRVCGLIR